MEKNRVEVESNTSISTVFQFMQNFLFNILQLDLCSLHKCHCSAAHPLILVALEYFSPFWVFSVFSAFWFHFPHTSIFATKQNGSWFPADTKSQKNSAHFTFILLNIETDRVKSTLKVKSNFSNGDRDYSSSFLGTKRLGVWITFH